MWFQRGLSLPSDFNTFSIHPEYSLTWKGTASKNVALNCGNDDDSNCGFSYGNDDDAGVDSIFSPWQRHLEIQALHIQSQMMWSQQGTTDRPGSKKGQHFVTLLAKRTVGVLKFLFWYPKSILVRLKVGCGTHPDKLKHLYVSKIVLGIFYWMLGWE